MVMLRQYIKQRLIDEQILDQLVLLARIPNIRLHQVLQLKKLQSIKNSQIFHGYHHLFSYFSPELLHYQSEYYLFDPKSLTIHIPHLITLFISSLIFIQIQTFKISIVFQTTMSKQEYMKFGQIVRIHGHRLADQTESKRGMIVAKGFTDPDARYMTFDTFRNCQFYRQSLFQVLPKGNFETSTHPTEQEKKKIADSYEILIRSKMGNVIKFGEDVVFKHVDSQEYFSGSVNCSEGGLGAFKIQLTQEIQKNLVFKLYPFRSFEKEGDKIKLQSPLRIKNMENRCYISTEKGNSGEANQQSQNNETSQYNIVTTYSQSYTWLFHLHQSEQTLTNIEQIKTHDLILLRYTKNWGYLCLDRINKEEPLRAMVRLPKQETGFHCYTCLWQIQKQPIPSISPYPDKKLGTPETYTLRDVLTGEYLKVFPLIKADKKKDTGGIVTKSLESKVDQEQITIKSAKGLTDIELFIKDNGLVKISGPKSIINLIKIGEIDVENTQLTQLHDTKFNYRSEQPAELWPVIFLSGDGEHGFRIEKIDEESKHQVLFIISTYEVLDEFGKQLEMDLLQFQQKVKAKRFDFIDELLKMLIVFIKECNPNDIEEDTLPNKKKQYIAKDLKICDKLFKILRLMGQKILQQIYKKDKLENDAFKKVFNRAYYLILQIIKDNPITKLYVCEDWLETILNHAIENEEQRVHETLNQILQNNQLVVTKFLSVNDCHLIARIINVFSLKPPHEKFLNIFRASCMSNESPIVTNQKLILDYFFKKLTPDASFTFVKLRGSKGMSLDATVDPDKLYLKCSISKDQNRIRTLKDFFVESSKLDLSQTSNYFISYLNLLADICYGRNTQAKTYVESILAPDTTGYYDSEDEKYVEEDQRFDALYTLNYILQDKQIEQVRGYKNLLRAVLRVINYAFVESADQNPVLRIKRYRNIDKIGEKQNAEANKFERLKSVMDFVKEKIENFRSFYDDTSEDQDQKKDDKEEDQKSRLENEQRKRILKKERQIESIQEKRFLYTQLILLRSTLFIGYWKVEEQKTLLTILLKVLRNSKKTILHYKEDIDNADKEIREFQKFKQEARRRTPTVQLITACKALVCELIEIIFDFRHDDLVTKCVGVYKQMQEMAPLKRIGGGHKIIIDRELDINHDEVDEYGPIVFNANQWKKRLIKIFDNESEEDKDKQSNDQQILVPLMIELGIHKDPILFFRSLKILNRYFKYRSQILGLFLNLSVYNSESGEYLEDEISKKRKQLNTLEEENLLYAKDKSGVYENIMYFLVWLSESIKINFELTERPHFKNFKCIFDHFHEKSQINQFHQSAIKNMDLHRVLLNFISLSRQPLSTYSDDARTVLKYVYRFLALLCKGYNEAKMQIYNTDKISAIMKKHLKQEVELLQKFDISDTKNVSIEALKRRDDCEAIQLLFQLYSHNKFILFNEVEMEEIIESICEMINGLNLTNYYKSHLLDFLRSIIYFRDQKIIINQSRILAKLQDPKKEKIYYRILEKNDPDSSNLVKFIHNLLQQFEDQNFLLKELEEAGVKSRHSEKIERDLIISPQLTYFITLFNVFGNLVEGKHTVNIGKGRQVHSYEMLMNVLEHAKFCYPLKASIRNYINQLYYSTQIEEDLYNLIVKLQLPLMINDLNLIITILIKDLQTIYSIVHPVRYRYYQTYIFLYVEQILLSLNYLFCESDSEFFKTQLKKELTSNYSKGHYYLHYFIIRIYERLRWLSEKYYNHKYFRGLLNMISNKMRIEFLDKFKDNSFRIFDRDEEDKHQYRPNEVLKFQQKQQLHQKREVELKNRCKIYLHKLVKGQIGDFFIQERPEKNRNFPLTFTLPYEEKKDKNDPVQAEKKEKQMKQIAQKLTTILFPDLRQQKERINHGQQLQTLKGSLSDNYGFQNFLQSYMVANCKKLYEVDKYSTTYYNFISPFVEFSEYIKIFVSVNSEEPHSIPNNLRIFFFNMIQWYIQQERRDHIMARQDLSEQQKIKEMSKYIQKWGKQDWDAVNSQIRNNQQFLAHAQVAQLIISSLQYAEELQLYAAIFRFCIGYLLGGNNLCQNTLYQKLRQDHKNSVFIKIERLISRLGKRITSRIAERTNKVRPAEDQFLVQPLDQYDYYDESIKGMKKFQSLSMPQKQEEQQEILEKQVFGMIFKFLQLLCQCNNIDLKNFVREQTNTDGEKKSYSFNLINVAIFEIRRLFKVMDKEASGVIVPLIDFVNEVVTIPCIENQQSLCETTFFDDLCYMASFFSESANIKARGFEGKQSELLDNIYKQSILVILNVLQSSEPTLIREMLLKIKPRFLLDIIKRNLLAQNIRTKAEFKQKIVYQQQSDPKVPTRIEDSMNVLIVISKLEACEGSEKFKEEKEAYYAEIAKELDESNKIELKDLVACLRQQMLKIQIISKSTKKMQLVYFPNHPILKTLSPLTRDRIMLDVSRSTQRQKIRSLFAFREEIIAQIEHNFQIQKQKLFGLFPYTPAQIVAFQYYLFAFSHTINMIWFYFTYVTILDHEVHYLEEGFSKYLLFGLDVIQLIITSFYVLSYTKCQYALARFRAEKAEQEQNEESSEVQQAQEAGNEHKSLTDKAIKVAMIPVNIILSILTTIVSIINKTPLGTFIYSLMTLFKFDEKFTYVFLYFVVSLFGTFYSQQLFLLYIIFYFMKNDTLSNVFNAIVYTFSQLVSVALLGSVFLYVFCLVFYETYALQIMSGAGDQACQTIYGCIMDLFVSGTIGGDVQELELTRFTTDMIYFIFFEIFFGGIVESIMINAFSSLRQKRDEMNDDKKNKCYICGKDRATLQKYNQNFDEHIKGRHFLWNYIYYTYCLDKKHQTDYSGLEYEIRNCLDSGQGEEENKIMWIPFESQSDENHDQTIRNLSETVLNLTEKIKQKIDVLKAKKEDNADDAIKEAEDED